MKYRKIFRDDDVSHLTDLALFKKVHDFFREHIMLHTIALIVKDIEQNPELIQYIRTNNFDVQVHCWTHYDLTTDYDQAAEDLQKCIDTIEKIFGERPTVLYPPWNRTSQRLTEIAGLLGLKVSTEKVSLDQYCRCNGDVKEEVINFHYWAYQEQILLEPALKIYNTKRK